MRKQTLSPLSLPAIIIEAVRLGHLREPFTRLDVEATIEAARRYALHYRTTVLPNNEINGNYKTGFFERVGPGMYRVSRYLLN